MIPAFVPPARIVPSPLTGAPERERNILLFFRGDVGLNRRPNYSRGIRQRLYALAKVPQPWLVLCGHAERRAAMSARRDFLCYWLLRSEVKETFTTR